MLKYDTVSHELCEEKLPHQKHISDCARLSLPNLPGQLLIDFREQARKRHDRAALFMPTYPIPDRKLHRYLSAHTLSAICRSAATIRTAKWVTYEHHNNSGVRTARCEYLSPLRVRQQADGKSEGYRPC
jgi:hypothetical protein